MTFKNKIPLVSIGIPTYNRADSLRIAIESAIKQDYDNVQIIISDNCSNDSTRELCEDYIGLFDNIKYYRSEKNLGPTENFRIALEKSSGEYFMWLADDDFIDENYISECLMTLLANKELVMVGGKSRSFGGRYDGFGRKFSINHRNALVRIISYYLSPGDNSIFYGLMPTNLAKLNEIKPSLSADWHFIAGMLLHGGILTSKDTTIHRKASGTSVSLTRIAETLGISRIQTYFFGISIAICGAKDILSDNKIYSNKSVINRVPLAATVFLIVLLTHGFFKTFRLIIYNFLVGILGFDNYNKIKLKIKSNLFF